MNLILLGPPGAGKGTQAARVARTRRIPVISTGDILRGRARTDSPAGRAIEAILSRGELVSDEAMVEILAERLSLSDTSQGFVLDGFPRTVDQAVALDALMERRGPVIVVAIEVPHAELIRRVSRRLICDRCGMNSGIAGDGASIPSRQCHCGGSFQPRADDSEGVARERLRIYEQATKPLVDFYQNRSTFCAVDGTLHPDRVTAQIGLAIDAAAVRGSQGIDAIAPRES